MISVSNVKTAFVEEAMKAAGLPYGEDNEIRQSTLFRLSQADRRSHAKFLRQMRICATLKAPFAFFTELDTYKFLTRMSTSVMHLVLAEGVSGKDFELITSVDLELFSFVSEKIDQVRKEFDSTMISKKDAKKQIKKLIPGSFYYTSFIEFNYETLRNIYLDRINHELSWWQEFLKGFEEIPYFNELIKGEF